jgi:hypothetical protein
VITVCSRLADWIQLCTLFFQAAGDAELKLELSSPVEEVILNAGNAYKASFRGVETGQATLSIGAGGGDAAAVVDVAEFTVQKLQAMAPAPEYVTSKDIGGKYQLQITYRPSKKDQREELYELLNKATQRKATAREDLRQAATNMPTTTVSATTSGSKPAVQAGFLNKKSSGPAAPPKWKIWYRRLAVIVPIAKNYVLFGGFLVFSHFQGQYLAIPPPV